MFVVCKGSGYCALDEQGNDRPNISQIFEPYARAIAGAPTASTYDCSTKRLKVVYRDSAAAGTTDIFIPESRNYPNGWKVLTSDAAGTWSQTFDEASAVLSVTVTKDSGDHAICVVPKDSTITVCPVVDSKPVALVAPAAPATAVAATPTFTG